MNETHQLAKEFSTDFRKLTVISKHKVLERDPLTRKTSLKDIKELRLLHFLTPYIEQVVSSDMDFEEALDRACNDARVEKSWAIRYLKSKSYERWINARMEEVAAKEGLTVGKLAKKLNDGIDGVVKFDDSQKFCIDQVTRRIWPEVSKIEQKIVTEEVSSMDELAKARDEVNELEKKLRDAMSVPTTAKHE